MGETNGNGFRIRGWKDVLTVLTIMTLLAGMFASAVVWGIRMDNRTIQNSNEISALKGDPRTRPDPFTGTEGRALERRLADAERRLDRLEE